MFLRFCTRAALVWIRPNGSETSQILVEVIMICRYCRLSRLSQSQLNSRVYRKFLHSLRQMELRRCLRDFTVDAFLTMSYSCICINVHISAKIRGSYAKPSLGGNCGIQAVPICHFYIKLRISG